MYVNAEILVVQFAGDDNGMASMNNGFIVEEAHDEVAIHITGRTHKAVWESMRASVEAHFRRGDE